MDVLYSTDFPGLMRHWHIFLTFFFRMKYHARALIAPTPMIAYWQIGTHQCVQIIERHTPESWKHSQNGVFWWYSHWGLPILASVKWILSKQLKFLSYWAGWLDVLNSSVWLKPVESFAYLALLVRTPSLAKFPMNFDLRIMITKSKKRLRQEKKVLKWGESHCQQLFCLCCRHHSCFTPLPFFLVFLYFQLRDILLLHAGKRKISVELQKNYVWKSSGQYLVEKSANLNIDNMHATK